MKRDSSALIGMIPARLGSERLKRKNLALLAGKPLITYAIDAAKKSKIFDRIVVNSEASEFKKIAKQCGVEFYKRPKSLGSSATKSDDVIYDFLNKYSCHILAWVFWVFKHHSTLSDDCYLHGVHLLE